MPSLIQFAERGLMPDSLVRLGIKRLCSSRLEEEYFDQPDLQSRRYDDVLSQLKASRIAEDTDAANQQHYELPPTFFERVLGDHLKYSACYWDETTANLSEAEAAMLALYTQRAELRDGQSILELGCGWGSLTLWMARHFPTSQITAVSNSKPQREFIEGRARAANLKNVKVITCDVNELQLEQQFDRIVSVEMFEHVRNYQKLFDKLNDWLQPGGKLFVHIFCHRYLLYPFEVEGETNWMGRYFFTGGVMPAADTLLRFQQQLQLQQQWLVSGTHYQRTAEAWLDNMDEHRTYIKQLFRETYGKEADVWVQRWRMFFMACAELFGFNEGNEWLVSHYLFNKPSND